MYMGRQAGRYAGTQARRHAGTQAGRQVSRSHLRAWSLTHALLLTFSQGGLPREELKQVYGLMSVRGLRKPAWQAALTCLLAYNDELTK